jgi:hypothetical protein
MPASPATATDTPPDDLLQVRSTCLTVAATLGAQLERLCIVGGLVPNLLIDEQVGPDPDTEAGHPGTIDLDVALQVALLDDQGYAEISTRLQQEGFGPDTNEKGNPTPQRWKLKDAKVTIDFLLPSLDDGPPPSRVQTLEPDFAALIIPGVELTADEREWIELEGHTLKGERITRTVPVGHREPSCCARHPPRGHRPRGPREARQQLPRSQTHGTATSCRVRHAPQLRHRRGGRRRTRLRRRPPTRVRASGAHRGRSRFRNSSTI